jgi:hypothetical protein
MTSHDKATKRDIEEMRSALARIERRGQFEELKELRMDQQESRLLRALADGRELSDAEVASFITEVVEVEDVPPQAVRAEIEAVLERHSADRDRSNVRGE